MQLSLSDLQFLSNCLDDVINQCGYDMPWMDTEEDKDELRTKEQKAARLQDIINKEIKIRRY